MARIEIYIDGQLADYDKVDLSFVYSVEDDDSLSVSGSYSKRSIKLPATKRNNRIFGNAIELQQPQNLNTKLLSLPSRIIVDGLPIFIGHAQVDKATINKYAKTYEVIFLADNSDWIEQLRDVGMDDIPMPTTLQYTPSNVMNNYAAFRPSSDGFCFFLPKVAEWASTTGQVSVEELYPAIYLEYIIRKAFSNIEYTINSSFFNTKYFKSLIVPVLARNYDTKWARNKTYVQLLSINTAFNQTAQVFYYYAKWNTIYAPGIGSDSIEQTPTSTVFHPQLNGKYRFSGTLNFVGGTGTKPFYVIRNGVFNNTFQYRTDKFACKIDCFIGDYIEFWFNGVNVTSIISGSLVIEYIGQQDSIPNVPNVTISNIVGTGAPIYEINQLCAKWKVLDIIADIQKIFNLVFVSDPNKREVTIEPRDYWVAYANNYFDNGTGLYTDNKDITDKLDISKEVQYEYNPDADRYIEFNWKDDDPTCKAYEEEREGVKLYSHKYDRGERFTKQTKEINLGFFSKCFHIQDSEINPEKSNQEKFYQLPLLYYKNWFDGNREKTPNFDNQTAYLLFHYGAHNPQGAGNVPIKIYDKANNVTYNFIPLAWMVWYNDNQIQTLGTYFPHLSFSKEGYTYSLITSFHDRDLERQAQNVRVEGYIDWSNIDIFNLDFKRKYVINQVPYILKKIDGYNPATGTTTKTVLQIDSRIMFDDDFSYNGTGVEGIDSDLKGLIVI